MNQATTIDMPSRQEMNRWKPNLLAMTARLRGNRLVLRYRGWRPTAVLLILIGIFMFGFSGGRLDAMLDLSSYDIMALPALAFLIVSAFLAMAYVQEIVLDFATRRLQTRNGFFWRLKRTDTPFSAIEGVRILSRRPMVTPSSIRPGMEATGTGWDVILVPRDWKPTANLLSRIFDSIQPGLSNKLGLVFPGFNVWRAPDEQRARLVANALAERIGCTVQTTNQGG